MSAFPEGAISPPEYSGPCRGCDGRHIETVVRASINEKLAEFGLSAQVCLNDEDKFVAEMIEKMRLDWGSNCVDCAREARADEAS